MIPLRESTRGGDARADDARLEFREFDPPGGAGSDEPGRGGNTSRFLISTMPAFGHVNPTTPVSTALVERGHDVVWQHTGPEYRATVEATGAVLAPARRTPSFGELPGEPDPGTTGVRAAMSAMRNLFVERMPGQLADYEEILGR